MRIAHEGEHGITERGARVAIAAVALGLLTEAFGIDIAVAVVMGFAALLIVVEFLLEGS